MEICLVLLLFCLGLCAGSDVFDVIVVGAGASGLSAARTLTDLGRFKVTVLEARDNRYGGRIWTNTETFPNASGPEVEMGAGFIHHPDDINSVVQLHREFNIPMLELNRGATIVVREKDNKPFTLNRVSAAYAKVNQVLERASNYSQTAKKDMSLREALRRSNQASMIDDPLSQLGVSLTEFSFGTSLENISAKLKDVGYAGVDENSDKLPSMGYGKLLDRLVQRNESETPLNIRLGQEVTEVKVEGKTRVSVKCRDGTTYTADSVILTLPLGVLKANDVTFEPDLPKTKKKAIKRIGFGVINKVILEFDRKFWPMDKELFGIAVQNGTDRGKLTTIAAFKVASDRPILAAYAVSNFGPESEKLSDYQLKRLALRRLRLIYGKVMDTVTVVRMARTRWLADKFARGAYSFPAVGTREDDWDIVGEAVGPLFFAGEHTRTELYGTVQNAIDTGRRAANQVLAYLSILESQSNAHSIFSPGTILSICALTIVSKFAVY